MKKVLIITVSYDETVSYWKISLKEIKSIYYRKIDFPNLDEYDIKFHLIMKKELLSFIEGIANSFEGRVLTKPYILRDSENKIKQLLMAEKIGFLQPNSLITNCEVEANVFSNSKNKKLSF